MISNKRHSGKLFPGPEKNSILQSDYPCLKIVPPNTSIFLKIRFRKQGQWLDHLADLFFWNALRLGIRWFAIRVFWPSLLSSLFNDNFDGVLLFFVQEIIEGPNCSRSTGSWTKTIW